MHIFPESGFDQSATTPVFLGVLVLWLFTESFGWVFAGLVVPGYLATSFVLDPRAATIDVGEAILTYTVAHVLGENLSSTGLTSRLFGRERFLLIVIVSILVRLGVEGVAFAYLLPHATWAYSIGLVVVPLCANACWKTGLPRGVVQIGVPTAIVYLLLRLVLVPYTNLSLAGFHLATENIAASFLGSPKAYLLLLTGAVLAAVANIRYGWDYNGILLPALLALVVPNPLKLVATFAEVWLLLLVVRGLFAATPVGRWNIEGPRRPMLFFSIDYVLRFALAAFVGRSMAGTDFVEISGFGYLVPALLATKVSQKGLASLVLLPAVCVSGATFALGSLLGFMAERLDPAVAPPMVAVTRELARAPSDTQAAALWASALARPAVIAVPTGPQRSAAAYRKLVDDLISNVPLPAASDIETQRLTSGVLLLRERFQDPHARLGAPTVLVAPRLSQSRIVALVTEPLSAPETASLGGHLLALGLVDALVIAGVDGDPMHTSGALNSARATARALAEEQQRFTRRGGVVVVLHRVAGAELRVGVTERAANAPRVRALLAALQRDSGPLVKRPAPRVMGDEVLLDLPAGFAPVWLDGGSSALALSPVAVLAGAFDGVTTSVQRPCFEDLLALRRLVLTPLLSSTVTSASLPWLRACAASLGYRLLGPATMPDGGAAVVLRPRAAGGTLACLVRLQKKSGVTLEVPRGSHDALRSFALRLADRMQADAVLTDLASDGGALGSVAFAEAHAAATWSLPDSSAKVVVLREAMLSNDASEQATLGVWGGEAGAQLAQRSATALGEIGVVSASGSLDLETREWAGRSVLGKTPLVAVTLDSRFLRRLSAARGLGAFHDFPDLAVLDQACGDVAVELSHRLVAGRTPAPATLLQSARRAAVERSVVARRALQAALADTASLGAIARTSSGLFLVVVGRAPHELVAGAYPLAMMPDRDAVPRLRTRSIAGCEAALRNGGECSVVGEP